MARDLTKPDFATSENFSSGRASTPPAGFKLYSIDPCPRITSSYKRENDMRRKALLVMIALASANAMAQSMVEADMAGQPLSYSQGGVTDGCGVRIVGVLPADSTPTKKIKTFDVSANVWHSGNALVKLVGQVVPSEATSAGQAKRVRLFGGWLKAEGKSPAAPIGGSFKESPTDKNAYLFPVNSEGALAFILAASKGDRVQVGLSWDGKNDWIYFGVVKLSDEDKNQINLCLKEVLSKPMAAK